jgi:hypothetical protein
MHVGIAIRFGLLGQNLACSPTKLKNEGCVRAKPPHLGMDQSRPSASGNENSQQAGWIHSQRLRLSGPLCRARTVYAGGGVKPALHVGESFNKHLDQCTHFGGHVPAVGIECNNLELRRLIVLQQRH